MKTLQLTAMGKMLMAALGLSGAAIPQGPSEPALSKRLADSKRTFNQWAHNMIVSSPDDIRFANSLVRRRNRRFAAKKGLA
jgi:hypothetical protein